MATLPQLQAAGTEGPTMVWHRAPPACGAYCHTRPTAGAVDRAPDRAVACFRCTARCLAHKCPGHPNKGPL